MIVWQSAEAEFAQPNMDPAYWATAWAGGQAVARYLFDNPHIVQGRSLLDIASGSGLCALAAAKAGACAVTAFDIDPLSLAAIRENAAANDVILDARLQDLLPERPPDVDIVVAGDVCYDRDMADRTLRWLRACHDHGSTVLLGDPGRAYLPSQGLRELARY